MQSLGLLVIRVVVGIIFVLHGVPKLVGGSGTSEKLSSDQKRMLGDQFSAAMENGGIENTTKMLESLNVPNPKAMAWVTALTETLGGLAIILGIKTRPAAIGLATTQIVAIGKMNGDKGLIGGYEFNLSLLAATAGIAIAGPGKLAKD